MISRVGNNSELFEIVTKNSTEVAPILTKKDPNAKYYDWLLSEMSASQEDRVKLIDAQAKINSIIPTLSPMSNNQNAASVSLRDYTVFIEKKFLKDFGIMSLSPLGIAGVKYQEDKDGGLSSPIGEFTADITFEATNGNIQKLLDFIDTLGEPTILSSEEILQNPPAVMSNPLVTLETLNLEKFLNPEDPTFKNSGRLVLKFYVRGSSNTDRDYLLESFNKKRNALAEEISTKIAECEKNTSCVMMDSYKTVEKKFQNFNNSITEVIRERSDNSIEIAYIIAQQLQTLQSLRTEFESIK